MGPRNGDFLSSNVVWFVLCYIVMRLFACAFCLFLFSFLVCRRFCVLLVFVYFFLKCVKLSSSLLY